MNKEVSNLSYMNHAIDELHRRLQNKIDNKEISPPTLHQETIFVLFLSIGNGTIRARVDQVIGTSLSRAVDQIRKKATLLIQKKHVNPEWIKLDLVTKITQLPFRQLEEGIVNTRRNYFRSGIAFDDAFRLSFLEQEINSNAMIRSINNGPLQLNEKNINHYLKSKSAQISPFVLAKYKNKRVYTFQTKSVFASRDENKVFDLYDGKLTNGIRKNTNLKETIQSLIQGATNYLTDQIKSDGQFEYGYFPTFAKRIGTYNILRHSSSLYAMAEGYELLNDNRIIHAVEKGIDYVVREAMVYKDKEDVAFMVDTANKNEIKLGSNATAILAMTKYMEVTSSKKFLKEAQALARGIIQMKTISGGFIHVLSYPSFEIKDLHRIIYYEGEAVFALLRLFALDKREEWLEESRKSLDYFIDNDYWKHHDHWLGYASNEITDYIPADKYFEFGLRNCQGRLNFIYHRDTTYPTFLELTMATYKLVKKIKYLGKEHLLEHINETQLESTIDRRAEYQRVGYFYPEQAMYMKNPALILHGCFIRHHSFRVRIDDVEHYLSGYCQFIKYRLPDIQKPLTITDI